jgi:hypothetical protein
MTRIIWKDIREKVSLHTCSPQRHVSIWLPFLADFEANDFLCNS